MKRKFGTWREMEFDSVVHLHGLTWWRVEGGFGNQEPFWVKRDRQDWVADVPGMAIGVHAYSKPADADVIPEERVWGFHEDQTFSEACISAIKQGKEVAGYKLDKAVDELATIHAGRRRLAEAVRNLEGGTDGNA